MQRAIELCVLTAQSCTSSEKDRNTQYEAEIRIGVRVNDKNRRCADGTRFASNIQDVVFFATFSALCRRADEISEQSNSNHERFASFEILRREIANSQTRYVEKSRVLQPNDFSTPCWFDVRVSVSKETVVPEPAPIREARAYAVRVSDPLESPRTRIGVPNYIRSRERRSLRFADCALWRLDFTVVATSKLIRANVGSGSAEYTFVTTPEVLEMEMEYVGSNINVTPQKAAIQACMLLDKITTALGSSKAEISKKLSNDRLEAEMQSIKVDDGLCW